MNTSILARSLILLAISAAGLAVVVLLPGASYPSSPRPALVMDWWDTEGTASAAIATLRGLMLGAFAYVLLVSVVTALLSIRPRARASTAIPRLANATLRRYLAGGAMVLSTLSPSIAAAQAPAPAPFVLVDLGPSGVDYGAHRDPPAFAAVDLGATGSLPGDAAADNGVDNGVDEVYIVERGDHLWLIAADTLTEHNREASDREITLYWRRLIEVNRDTVGADPDLIHPGQRITLPPISIRSGG